MVCPQKLLIIVHLAALKRITKNYLRVVLIFHLSGVKAVITAIFDRLSCFVSSFGCGEFCINDIYHCVLEDYEIKQVLLIGFPPLSPQR